MMVALQHIFSRAALALVGLLVVILITPNILYFLCLTVPETVVASYSVVAPYLWSLYYWQHDHFYISPSSSSSSVAAATPTAPWYLFGGGRGGAEAGGAWAPPLSCTPTTTVFTLESTPTSPRTVRETISIIHSHTRTEYSVRTETEKHTETHTQTVTRTTILPRTAANQPSNTTMSWFQKTISLPPAAKGSYLVTKHVLAALPEVAQFRVGLLTLFVQHTSCGLGLCENWDEDVRADMTAALDRIVPEQGPGGEALYEHSAEGPDDMPVRGCLEGRIQMWGFSD